MPDFACDRQALSAEERKRHFDILGPKLGALKLGVRELANGYEFEFPRDAHELVAEWVAGERRCCPFFAIDVRPERDFLWLRLSGADGAKEFIRSELFQLFETA